MVPRNSPLDPPSSIGPKSTTRQCHAKEALMYFYCLSSVATT